MFIVHQHLSSNPCLSQLSRHVTTTTLPLELTSLWLSKINAESKIHIRSCQYQQTGKTVWSFSLSKVQHGLKMETHRHWSKPQRKSQTSFVFWIRENSSHAIASTWPLAKRTLTSRLIHGMHSTPWISLSLNLNSLGTCLVQCPQAQDSPWFSLGSVFRSSRGSASWRGNIWKKPLHQRRGRGRVVSSHHSLPWWKLKKEDIRPQQIAWWVDNNLKEHSSYRECHSHAVEHKPSLSCPSCLYWPQHKRP